MFHYGHTGYRNTHYLQNTQRTLFECSICDKYFTLNESLKFHGIEVHSGQYKHFKEAFEDHVEGCDDEQFEIRPCEESSGSVLISSASTFST